MFIYTFEHLNPTINQYILNNLRFPYNTTVYGLYCLVKLLMCMSYVVVIWVLKDIDLNLIHKYIHF